MNKYLNVESSVLARIREELNGEEFKFAMRVIEFVHNHLEIPKDFNEFTFGLKNKQEISDNVLNKLKVDGLDFIYILKISLKKYEKVEWWKKYKLKNKIKEK